ncbi:hypothetical protein D6C86_00278 [Aureobasidium pullulans]|uniref:Bromo domain-containing protein n=1 Tax=Aureobasidium pullulans TaxID=5580 RepID=A0A4S9Q3S5_AURPU|nr:hypothetical protein D6C94_01515 [Aureobasidium pullulans]THZ68000.1 hypothetical protein D6C86_00278 [Aureobasidium pullulans]
MSRRFSLRDKTPKARRPILTETQRSTLVYKFCEHVLQGLITSDDECVQPFLELVDRGSDDGPEYYSTIERPIALSTISRRLKNEQYSAIHQFKKDFELMLNNCFRYNESSSEIYKQGKRLQTAFNTTMALKEAWESLETARLYPSSIPSEDYATGSDSDEDESDTPDEYDSGMYRNEMAGDTASESSDRSDEDEFTGNQNSIADEDDFAPHSVAEETPHPDAGNTAQSDPKDAAHFVIETTQDTTHIIHKSSDPLQTMLETMIETQITLLTTRITTNANNEFTDHLPILSQLWSENRKIAFYDMWKRKAMDRVEDMGFKKIKAEIGGQVERAFGETVKEQARVVCEEIREGAAGLERIFGED